MPPRTRADEGYDNYDGYDDFAIEESYDGTTWTDVSDFEADDF